MIYKGLEKEMTKYRTKNSRTQIMSNYLETNLVACRQIEQTLILVSFWSWKVNLFYSLQDSQITVDLLDHTGYSIQVIKYTSQFRKKFIYLNSDELS